MQIMTEHKRTKNNRQKSIYGQLFCHILFYLKTKTNKQRTIRLWFNVWLCSRSQLPLRAPFYVYGFAIQINDRHEAMTADTGEVIGLKAIFIRRKNIR